MKIGDPILVYVGDDNWRSGTFLGQRLITENRTPNQEEMMYMVGIGEPHYFNYEEKEVYPHLVLRFIPLTEEAAKAKHDAELPLAFAMVQAALAELLPGVTAEIKTLDVKRSIKIWRATFIRHRRSSSIRFLSGGSISAFGITLDPVVYETPLIGAVQETVGWQVTEWKYYRATHQPEEWPEEWVDSPVGEPAHYVIAVQRFIEAIFKAKANSYWNRLAEDEQVPAGIKF